MDTALVWLGGFFLIGLLAGLFVGRWWALLLVVLVPLAYLPAGEDSDGAPAWAWALILLVPPTLVGVAVGVAVRRRQSRRQRGARPAAGASG